jgi:lysophospholipase
VDAEGKDDTKPAARSAKPARKPRRKPASSKKPTRASVAANAATTGQKTDEDASGQPAKQAEDQKDQAKDQEGTKTTRPDEQDSGSKRQTAKADTKLEAKPAMGAERESLTSQAQEPESRAQESGADDGTNKSVTAGAAVLGWLGQIKHSLGQGDAERDAEIGDDEDDSAKVETDHASAAAKANTAARDTRPAVPDFVEIPGNAVPDGCIRSIIKTPSGLRLRAAMWPLPKGRAKGTICVFQGRTESIEKYFETINDLRERGFWVATLDWRGQGGSDRLLSDPLKGHVDGFSGYREDLHLFMHDVVLPDCPPPYFALAHSMGGLILLHTAAFKGNWFERIVSVAPLIGLPEDGGLMGVALPIAQTMRAIGLGRMNVPARGFDKLPPFSNNPLTSDAERYTRWAEILKAGPHLRVGKPTFGWLAAMGDAMDLVNGEQFPTRVQVPVLMVSAGLDRVVSSRATELLGKRLRIGGHISVDSARHEILQERDTIRDSFMAAFDTFIPGTPTGL